METVIHSYAISKDCELRLLLSTDSPTELLDYLEHHKGQNNLYILDVDLAHDMDGIVLASKIREKDVQGKIVFVTTYDQLSYLTFRYKVEALDYIIKDNPQDIIERVWKCIDLAYERYVSNTLQKDYYQVNTGSGVQNIPINEIMFFESHQTSHKLILHTENSRIEFYDSLSNVTEASPYFYRSHKSFVVNVKNIKYVNKKERKIEMFNNGVALITVKKIRGLLEAMQEI